MSWISLVCLLALSSNAFARSMFGSGYGSAPAPPLDTLPPTSSYGGAAKTFLTPKVAYGSVPVPRPDLSFPKTFEGYGSTPALPVELPVTKTFEGYGSAPRFIPSPRVEILTPKTFEGYGATPALPVELPVTKTFEGYGSTPSLPVELPVTKTFEGYGSGSRFVPSSRIITSPRIEILTPKKFEGYGATPSLPVELPVTKTFEGYGSAPRVLPAPRIFSGYGSQNTGVFPISDPIMPVQTEADIMCQGKAPDTYISIGDGRKYIACSSEGHGLELFCPKGLYFSVETRRCDYRPGSMPDACVSQPCLNGGQCVSSGASFECLCTPGFDGRNCEFDARVCQTQSPCGVEGRCQSFRPDAALSYVCIFQGGAAYGFSSAQMQANPCGEFDGTFGLGITNRGFAMCDKGRLSIESCPGGTIWNDMTKACSWPESEIPASAPIQVEQRPSYSQNYATEVPRIAFDMSKFKIQRTLPVLRSGY